MPVGQLSNRQPVSPDVLLAVGQRRAVRPDRRGHPPAVAADLLAGRRREFDAASHQTLCVLAAYSARRETVEGCLITRRRSDCRARLIEGPVSCDDLLWRVKQQARRPQVVGQVVAPRLQFRCQAAIADQHGIVGGCERHLATLRSVRNAYRSGNGGDTPGTRRRVHGGCGTHEAICSANTAKYHRRDSALSVAPCRNERVASGDRPEATRPHDDY